MHTNKFVDMSILSSTAACKKPRAYSNAHAPSGGMRQARPGSSGVLCTNQAIRTRLENGLDAGRFRGKFRVIPRYSAAEYRRGMSGIAVPSILVPASALFRILDARIRVDANSALGCSGRDLRPNSLVSFRGRA